MTRDKKMIINDAVFIKSKGGSDLFVSGEELSELLMSFPDLGSKYTCKPPKFLASRSSSRGIFASSSSESWVYDFNDPVYKHNREQELKRSMSPQDQDIYFLGLKIRVREV